MIACDKLRDYDRTPSIRHYVIVHQDTARVAVWTRAENGHLVPGDDVTGQGSGIDLPALTISLPLAAIYDGLFRSPAAPSG